MPVLRMEVVGVFIQLCCVNMSYELNPFVVAILTGVAPIASSSVRERKMNFNTLTKRYLKELHDA